MRQPCSTSSLRNEPVLSRPSHLGAVHVAGWRSPCRSVLTAWIHLTQQKQLQQQQNSFPGVRPIPCAPAVPAQVILRGMGNRTL